MKLLDSIVTCTDYDSLSTRAAELVFDRIETGFAKRNAATMVFPTGSTPIGMYAKLVSKLNAYATPTNTALPTLTTFNLDEYYPIERSHPQSYHSFMSEHLYNPLMTKAIQFVWNIPNGQAPDAGIESKDYEAKIANTGRIDLAVLGIGTNGHIAFNEPGSPPDSVTRLVEIDTSTIAANSRFFDSVDQVPTHAITMGISTILSAREVLLLAYGPTKKDTLKKLTRMQTPDSSFPASWLLTHNKVTILTDQEV